MGEKETFIFKCVKGHIFERTANIRGLCPVCGAFVLRKRPINDEIEEKGVY